MHKVEIDIHLSTCRDLEKRYSLLSHVFVRIKYLFSGKRYLEKTVESPAKRETEILNKSVVKRYLAN